MPDAQALQLILFSGGVELTCSVLVLSFSSTGRSERERSGRRRILRRFNRIVRLQSD